MCLSVPAEIISIEENKAKVRIGGVFYNANLHLVEDVSAGDFVLIHSGYAIQKIDKNEAEETLNFLREVMVNKDNSVDE